MRARKLRVGVIGDGAFARTCHLPGLAIAAVTLDPAELCASDRVDAVTVCMPNDAHGRHAQLALTRSKHVFCEKPLAPTARDRST